MLRLCRAKFIVEHENIFTLIDLEQASEQRPHQLFGVVEAVRITQGGC